MQAVAMRGACPVMLAVVVAMALLAAPAAGAPPVLDEEMAELAKMVRDECHGETGVDLSLVEKINAGADLMPDPTLKCYIKCVMETAGMFSEGVVDVDMVLTMLPGETGQKNAPALRACGTQTGADDCDTAYLTQVCWQKANKDDYFMI